MRKETMTKLNKSIPSGKRGMAETSPDQKQRVETQETHMSDGVDSERDACVRNINEDDCRGPINQKQKDLDDEGDTEKEIERAMGAA